MNSKHWYALYTKPRWEKKVAVLLDKNGFEAYCPMNTIIKHWGNRRVKVSEPLFKSYVFIKVCDEQKWAVKSIDGVLNYVYWLGKPAKIKDVEIEAVRTFVNSYTNINVTSANTVERSLKVIVTEGAFQNYSGIVESVLGNQVKVIIDSLGIKLTATLPVSKVKVVP